MLITFEKQSGLFHCPRGTFPSNAADIRFFKATDSGDSASSKMPWGPISLALDISYTANLVIYRRDSYISLSPKIFEKSFW